MRPFRAGFALPGFFGSASRSPVAGYSNRNIITMINVLIVHYILPIRHPLHLVLSVKVTLSPRHCEDRTWQFDHWSRGKDTSAAASPHEARARAHKGPQLIAQGATAHRAADRERDSPPSAHLASFRPILAASRPATYYAEYIRSRTRSYRL